MSVSVSSVEREMTNDVVKPIHNTYVPYHTAHARRVKPCVKKKQKKKKQKKQQKLLIVAVQ